MPSPFDQRTSGEESIGLVEGGADLLQPLLRRPAGNRADETVKLEAAERNAPGVVLGELLALTTDANLPMLLVPGRPGAQAVVGRSVVDLHGAHIGAQVVLAFEQGDPGRPIVMGVLRRASWPAPEQPAEVSVEADGRRLVVDARDELVLRCGKACITLSRSGKVVIEGASLLSRATGVNRIKGGSIELN